jgi:hypothetical protein
MNSDSKALPKYVWKRIKHSISALRQMDNKKRNRIWMEEWEASNRYKCFKAKDTIPPTSQKFLMLISDHRISRQMASLIFQMRVRHAPLNSFLHHIQKVNSARCPACGDPRETVEHFLL